MFSKIFLIIFLLIPMSANSTNLPQTSNVVSFQCSQGTGTNSAGGGGVTLPNGSMGGYFAINAHEHTAADFAPFFKNGVLYQIAAGTYFHAVMEYYNALTGTTGAAIQLVSSQTTFAQDAGSIVSGLYQMGASTSVNGIFAAVGTTAAAPQCYNIPYTFGNASNIVFPGIQQVNLTDSSITVIGYESNNPLN